MSSSSSSTTSGGTGSAKKKPSLRASSGGGGVGSWFTCPKCGRRFPRSAQGKHSSDSSEGGGCGDNPPLYPYIWKGAVHGVLVNATTTSKIQNIPFVKCPRLSGGTIFMPEELIKEGGLMTFAWVTVSIKDNENDDYTLPVALRVWPTPESISASSTSGNVMMTKDGFLANNVTPSDLLELKIKHLCKPTSETISPLRRILVEVDDTNNDIDEVTFDPSRFIKSFKNWFRGRFVGVGNVLRIRYYADVIRFTVKEVGGTTIQRTSVGGGNDIVEKMGNLSVSEEGSLKFFEVTDGTEVDIVFKSRQNKNEEIKGEERDVSLEDVGGIDPIIQEVLASVRFILSSKINVAKGILFHGHSGTGKSFLVKALCNHLNLTPVEFNEFVSSSSKKSSNTSNSIAKVFQDAISKSPSAIIIENLDVLAPSKSSNSSAEGHTPSSNFAVNLQSHISKLFEKSSLSLSRKIVIFATATDPDSLDTRLRSPKVFGKEIELPVPSRVEREQILGKMLKRGVKHSLSEEDVKEIAASTHGFVGADLHGLYTQAVQSAIERCGGSEYSTILTMADIIPSLKTVKPSAVKSILVDVPDVRWNDIGGQEDLKFKLKQAIEWPLKHPEAFQRLGITPPKGILMYGPPGCSKTMIAKAIATESGLNFISVKGSELFSKWVGESEKAVRDVFKRARQVAPCVVFFDEIDSLGGERGGSGGGSSNVHERVLAQLLVELDGIEPLKDVTIVGATNRPDIIDQALLRPGRLDRIIYVPLPDEETRREILKIKFAKMPVDPSVDVEHIVGATEGYSGAELTAVCHEAAMKALEENIEAPTILEHHFDQSLDLVKPRISPDQIKFYEEYSKAHKRL